MIRKRAASLLVLVAPSTLVAGCLFYKESVPTPVDTSASGSEVRTEGLVRGYMVNGHVVRFPNGIVLRNDSVLGSGTRYDARVQRVGSVQGIPLDSIVGLEAVQGGELNAPVTVVASLAAATVGALAAAGLAVAIFGSCPTVYVPAPDPAESALVAELFSHSVAPLLEARDVDVYPGSPDGGVLRLDLRNEALETHFINHLELIEVEHRPDEVVLSDAHDLPIALSGWIEPREILDRSGRDLRSTLASRDELAFASAPERVAAATADDLTDHIEIRLPTPTGVDSVALALDLRNSLLNTVFLYDFILAGEDLRGIEWLTGTLQHVGTAVEFGAWYQERMGMHVAVWDGAAWAPVARVPDTGPIAWKHTAVMIPVLRSQEDLRVRLTFLTDQWRIDRVRVAEAARRPETHTIPVDRVTVDGSGESVEMLAALLEPDEQYLETRPGTALWVDFQASEEAGSRSFLLASQGYYTEWLRSDWLRQGSAPEPSFRLGDEGLVTVLKRWQEVRPEMEAQFHDARLPTYRETGR